MTSLQENLLPICLRSVRGFHIGGHTVCVEGVEPGVIHSVPNMPPRVSNPNGHYMVGQMYVQHFALAQPRHPLPLLLWHGGGMTGSTWEQTPDGRPGWHEYFMRSGFDTCVSDAVDRGRASWAPPLIRAEQPEHRTIEQAWSIFRFGPASGFSLDPAQQMGYTGQRFPLGCLDSLNRQFVARWTQSGNMTTEAYCALVKKMGRSVIVAHSEGARHAMTVATQAAEHVAAIVLIEPAGAPEPHSGALKAIAHIPHCVVWGDYFAQSELWSGYRTRCDLWFDALGAAGGSVTTLDMPARGVKGNSHLLMMDNNSDHIAGLITSWLDKTLKKRS
ncbi:esterase [Pseudomonas typographi]|uniref:esterase n=1 Tax=Pseudomonas typographi TaxID=2715964 RepID=UPI001683D951|nr:esterase [Pseudomonas typographi]MBD1554581.1 esterase [Pseudomonas typographi]